MFVFFSRRFKAIGRYETHVLKPNTRCKYEALCVICGKTFSSPKMWNRHMLYKHQHDEVPCEKCGKMFRNKRVAWDHFKRVHRDNLSCEFCGKDFYNQTYLKTHVLTYHTDNNQKPRICDICGKGFVTKQKFEEHYRIHTNEKPFGCRICDYRSNSQANRLKHEKKSHGYYHSKEMKALKPEWFVEFLYCLVYCYITCQSKSE